MTQFGSQERDAKRRPSGSGVIRIEPGAAELHPERYRRRRALVETGLAWSAPLVFLAIWEVFSRAGLLDDAYFPPPSRVIETAVQLTSDGVLVEHMGISIRRVLFGFAIGLVTGTVVGTAMGLSRVIRATFDGLLTALYMVPKLAILPILLLIFGLGEAPKVLMIAITIFFFTWLQTMAAFASVPAGYSDAARSFGSTRIQRFTHVEFPAALPAMIVALRLNIGVAMLMVVSIEFVSASDGVGWLIWNSWSLLAADRMYAGILAVSLAGVLLTMLVRMLGRLAVPWAYGQGDNGNAAPF
jgi:ABC-type nitrate/sulfonate/bicarbonate transport system permease component